jgi:hypothetical protein
MIEKKLIKKIEKLEIKFDEIDRKLQKIQNFIKIQEIKNRKIMNNIKYDDNIFF